MGSIKVAYLVAKKLKSGKLLYYWQPRKQLRDRGWSAMRLSDDPLEAAQEAKKLNDAVQNDDRQSARRALCTDSIYTLIRLWVVSPEFTALAPRTRKDHGYALGLIEAWCGDERAVSMTRRAAREWYRALLETKGATHSRNIMATLRRLFAFAVDEEWIERNPIADLRMKTPASRDQVWLWDQVKAFIAQAKAMERPSVALAVSVAYWIAQRPTDILTLAWTKYDGAGVQVRQRKTGTIVYVPLPPDVCSELDEAAKAKKGTVIIVSEVTGMPYKDYEFQHVFGKIREKAGLPADLQFRDFRRTFLTDAGEGEATMVEMFSASGHARLESAEPYVKPSKGAAANAANKVAAFRSQRQRQNELEALKNAVGTGSEATFKK